MRKQLFSNLNEPVYISVINKQCRNIQRPLQFVQKYVCYGRAHRKGKKFVLKRETIKKTLSVYFFGFFFVNNIYDLKPNRVNKLIIILSFSIKNDAQIGKKDYLYIEWFGERIV